MTRDAAGGQEQPEYSAKQRVARLREAVRQQPHKMTLQLARQFGVPEVEVLRALPADRVMELDISRWEDLIRSLTVAGPVRVLVSNAAATIEAVGVFGGYSTTGEFFNVQTTSLDLHIRWADLASVFAVEKPGHMNGQTTHSIQFFDHAGSAAFKVFFSFGEPVHPGRHQLFCDLRKKFCL